ncbi:acyl carrier protein [Streptomyces sp. NPDC088157]|uniref:acyl carrier protein n=1 Tax=Streptomyces sp. NPDC088157 TaxID=3365832 RepID=UPI00382835A9
MTQKKRTPVETTPAVTRESRQVPDREDLKQRLAARLRLDTASLCETTTLEQLGLDSLLLAETVADVEIRCQVEFDMTVLAGSLVPTLPLSAFLDLLGEGTSRDSSRADA